jgi:hypothetical protein
MDGLIKGLTFHGRYRICTGFGFSITYSYVPVLQVLDITSDSDAVHTMVERERERSMAVQLGNYHTTKTTIRMCV